MVGNLSHYFLAQSQVVNAADFWTINSMTCHVLVQKVSLSTVFFFKFHSNGKWKDILSGVVDWQTGLVILLNQPKRCTVAKDALKKELKYMVYHLEFDDRKWRSIPVFLLWLSGVKRWYLFMKAVTITFGRLEMKRVAILSFHYGEKLPDVQS